MAKIIKLRGPIREYTVAVGAYSRRGGLLIICSSRVGAYSPRFMLLFSGKYASSFDVIAYNLFDYLELANIASDMFKDTERLRWPLAPEVKLENPEFPREQGEQKCLANTPSSFRLFHNTFQNNFFQSISFL